MRIKYTYFRHLFYFGIGGGISGLYNIDNNDTGIAGEIGGSLFFGVVKLNYYYRYNFIVNNVHNSYHEAVLSVSIGRIFVN